MQEEVEMGVASTGTNERQPHLQLSVKPYEHWMTLVVTPLPHAVSARGRVGAVSEAINGGGVSLSVQHNLNTGT